MAGRGCKKLAMTPVVIVVMLCQSIIQCYSFYGGIGAAYKSMSWSTSSRERAKLGRLDSEPPLLLREWPPETGRGDKREGGREGRAQKKKYRQTEGRRRSRSKSHNKQTKQVRKGRKVEETERKKTAEFTHLDSDNVKILSALFW